VDRLDHDDIDGEATNYGCFSLHPRSPKPLRTQKLLQIPEVEPRHMGIVFKVPGMKASKSLTRVLMARRQAGLTGSAAA
jgi:hypothetical protein